MLMDVSTLTDQAAVLVIGSYVERILEQAILSRLIKMTKPQIAGLFENGPLASMIAKNKMGLALGLYDAATFNDLEKIRQIRNAFAHSFHAITFKNPTIRAYCREFASVTRFAQHQKPPARSPFRKGTKWLGGVWHGSARNKFLLASITIGLGLTQYHFKPMRPKPLDREIVRGYFF